MTPDQTLAIHEAGHALAALTMGARLDECTIVAAGDLAGRVVSRMSSVTAHERLVMALAGPCAEVREAGALLVLDQHPIDARAVRETLVRLGEMEPNRSPAFSRALAATFALLDARRPALWRLADALLARKSLTHNEALAAVAGHRLENVA